MRKGTSNVKVISEGTTFYGISLGYDYCAEHEWGTAGITRKFGIDKEKMGIESRKITKHDRIYLETHGDYVMLTSRRNYKDKSIIENYIPKYKTNGIELETGWNEDDFYILTTTEIVKDYLSELYHAFQNNDIAIAKLAGGVFANSSLSILIASRIPQDQVDAMYNVDKKAHDLREYEKEIGLADLKEKAKSSGYQGNHYFMACSPSWINYEDAEAREERKKQLETKYDIQIWINYSDDDNNYGWYTAEEIIKWLSTPGLKLTQIRKAK